MRLTLRVADQVKLELDRSAIGRVAEVLGDIDAPGVDTEIIIRKYGIPDQHSSEAIAEAALKRKIGAVKVSPGRMSIPRVPGRRVCKERRNGRREG